MEDPFKLRCGCGTVKDGGERSLIEGPCQKLGGIEQRTDGETQIEVWEHWGAQPEKGGID